MGKTMTCIAPTTGVKQGYVVILQDVRGGFNSEGTWQFYVIDLSVYNMLTCFSWRDRDNSTRIKLWIGPCVCSGSMATTPHRCKTL